MKSAITLLLLTLVIITLIPVVHAWVNCTLSCPSGYAQIGDTTCSGSECNTTCVTNYCTGNWTQVFSAFHNGWNSGDSREDRATAAYTLPSSNALCYNFTFSGPANDISHIDMDVNDPIVNTTGVSDCDSEIIGGFKQATGETGDPNPWFEGMINYTGDSYTGVSPFDDSMKYTRMMVRSHTEADADQPYRDRGAGKGSIYCTNNSAACSLLGGTSTCDTDCYGNYINAYVYQGYIKDFYSTYAPATTTTEALMNMYREDACHNADTQTNRYQNQFTIIITSSPTNTSYNGTSCQRTNEAPVASGVNVKPANPTAGHALLCNYTFTDPEGDFDINSIITWYRNGVYQNVSEHQLLPNNYTLPGETWLCGVQPSDGNNIGVAVNATSSVTIQNTVANVTFMLDNTTVWNTTGYYAGPTTIPIEEELSMFLSNCTADAQGYCLIPLKFTSTRTGSLLITNISIYHNMINTSHAPIIQPHDAITVNETQFVNFSINVTDPGNNAFNVTINDPGRFTQTANYVYQWQTGYDDNGQYPVIITATNNLSISSTMSFTVTVNNVNRPFNVTYNNTAAQENQNVSANITINDPDNTNNNTADDNTFSYSFNSTFDSNAIAHLSYDEFFNYSVNVFINESIYNTTFTFKLFVLNVNRPPILSLSNITANEGELIILPNGTDPDNTNNVSNDDNSLSYTFSPPFNASGQWQTFYNQSGNYTANVTLSDGQYQVNQTINISVLNINQPPTLQFIPNVNVTAPANITITLNASDPDPGEILSYFVNDTHFSQNNNIFQWNATINDVGYYQVLFTVSDGLLNTSQLVNIAIIGPANMTLTNVSVLYNQSSSKIMEFVINNNGFAPLSGINWSIDFGDGATSISTSPIALFLTKKVFTDIQHTYTIGANVTVTINASATNISRTQSF